MNPLLLQIIQFGIPMAVANMTPVIVKGKIPIDFGKELKGKRLLGKGKTIEGTVIGILAGTIIGFLLGNAYLGLLVSTGALFGDISESFLKRRVGIKSGRPWWGFDQLDFVIGALILGSFAEPLMLKTAIILLVVSPPLHLLINIIGYKLKLKKVWW